VWANLQGILKRLYISIPNHNFILFFFEAEIRRSISSFAIKEKWIEVISI